MSSLLLLHFCAILQYSSQSNIFKDTNIITALTFADLLMATHGTWNKNLKSAWWLHSPVHPPNAIICFCTSTMFWPHHLLKLQKTQMFVLTLRDFSQECLTALTTIYLAVLITICSYTFICVNVCLFLLKTISYISLENVWSCFSLCPQMLEPWLVQKSIWCVFVEWMKEWPKNLLDTVRNQFLQGRNEEKDQREGRASVLIPHPWPHPWSKLSQGK